MNLDLHVKEVNYTSAGSGTVSPPSFASPSSTSLLVKQRLSPSQSNGNFQKIYSEKLQTSVLTNGKGVIRFNNFKDNHVKMAKMLVANGKRRNDASSMTGNGLSKSPSSNDYINIQCVETDLS